MKSRKPLINQVPLDELWSKLSQSTQAVFRTDNDGNSEWRCIIAFDPIDTFELNHPQELDKLRLFFQENQENLCAGYLSYDLGLFLQGISSRHGLIQPLAVFHAYNNWLEYDENEVYIVSEDKKFEKQLGHLLDKDSFHADHAPLRLQLTVDRDRYKTCIESIHDYIRAGDFYQINFTQQLEGLTQAPPRSLYANLIQGHPAAYACYFEHAELSILSLSPELFLHYNAGTLTTEPIKGTRPRNPDQKQDLALKQELLASAKEQAELFMITDLLRNDLGKVSEIGSVVISELKAVYKLPRVWHTYSRIRSKLHPDLQAVDALLSMFPGGSITGCPKRRAMEVIDELEISARGLYTGSLGYFHPDGDVSFNIAIRTLIQRGSDVTLGTGGGITIDSNWMEEWNELLVKASTFE
ncbi:anthranilate synthase component I family protein [bacterium]|nr:anthranilate synthase component I family protein [bacterium]